MDLSDHGKEQRNQYMREYNAKLSDEAKAAKAEYQRQYRRRPGVKEKIRCYNQTYWERKAQQAHGISDNQPIADKLSEITEITETDKKTSTCKYCSKEFTAKRRDAKFCSDSCRATHSKITRSLNK